MFFKIAKENRDKSGVYQITNTISKKIYIGSAKNFRLRFNRHISYLNTGTSNNPMLQKAWKKYLHNAFIFFILETCAIEDLTKTEQYYLDLLKPYDRNIGYNICKTAYNTLGRMHKKTTIEKMVANKIKKLGRYFEVCDKDGNLYKAKGVRKFCREHNLSQGNFVSMLNKKNTTSRGWHLPEYKGVLHPQRQDWPHIFKFKDKNGKLYEICENKIDEFCGELGWDRNLFIEWFMGKRKKYHELIRV